jgi:hypothetical protein
MAIKSTAKAEQSARSLKDLLVIRGFTVAESKVSGWPKLTLDTNNISIVFEAVDAVSKDIFGNDLKAFAPHTITVSMDTTLSTHLKLSKVLVELSKFGSKIVLKTSATDLATAEAASGDEISFDVLWPAN